MVKLGMTLLTTYPQSTEEVQKTVKEIHLYSYLNFAMNVVQGIQWNGQSSAVSVEFEEWLCECILKSKEKGDLESICYMLLHGKLNTP